MQRLLLWLVLAGGLGGCVSGKDASNGAIRVLNAVADSPAMSLFINGTLRVAGLGFPVGSAYVADPAGSYQVRIDEIFGGTGTPGTATVFDAPVSLAVNEELTLVVAGSVQAGTQEVLQVRTRTAGVPPGKARVQFLHAASGGQAFDVYLLDPGAVVSANAPLASGLAFRSATTQQEVDAGRSIEVVLTAVGNPSQVLYESGSLGLSLGTTLLMAVVPNTGYDAATRPFLLVLLSGTGSATVQNEASLAAVRAVNAAPGSYSLDAFVNASTVDTAARQDCDPATSETGTVLELCALAFGATTAFSEVAPGGYAVKLQKTGDAAVAAQSLAATFTASTSSTLLTTGLTADGATTTAQGLVTATSGRRIGGVGQLRIIHVSLAADAAVAGDPTTDRIDLYITAPGASLGAETADATGLRAGSDTGYLPLTPGSYQVALAEVDTAVSGGTPTVLFSRDVALDAAGLYTLVLIDSPGGVQPLQSISLDDSPDPAP